MNAEASIAICGETLLLHPDRAVIWPRCSAVIVADTHFGKSSLFNHNGIAVPAGVDQLDLAKLSSLLARFAANRLIILGDFVHGRLSFDSQTVHELRNWIRTLAGVKVQVVAGNHDRGICRELQQSVDWIEGSHREGPFCFVHERTVNHAHAEDGFSLSGHIHPVVALKGLRKRPMRVPAFWLQRHGLVLPSFGSFTGGFVVRPAQGEQMFAVSPEQVVPFPLRTSKL